MRNNEAEDARRRAEPGTAPTTETTTETTPEAGTAPDSPALPLLILAFDDDAVCVDDLCLPADARS